MASRLSSGTTLRKEGYLLKSGVVRWNLKRFYVIWRYPHLQWFYSETDSSPSGTIDIYEVTSLTLTGGMISITTPAMTVDFKAENAEDLNDWMATLRVGWEACMTYGHSPGVSLTARPHLAPAERPAPPGNANGGTSSLTEIVQPQPQRPGGGGARGGAYGRGDSGQYGSPPASPPDGCDSPITESPFLAEKIQRMRRSHSLGMYLARAPNSFVGSTSRGGPQRMAPFSGQTQGPDDHRFQSLTHRPFTDFLPSHHCRKTPVWRPYGPSGGAEGEGPEGVNNGYSYDGSAGGRPRGYSACSSDTRGPSGASLGGGTSGEQWRHGVHRSLSFVGGDDFQSLLLQAQDPPPVLQTDTQPRPRQSSHDDYDNHNNNNNSVLSSGSQGSSSLSASRSSSHVPPPIVTPHHAHSASVERCDDDRGPDLPLSPNQLLLLPLAHECPSAMNVPLAGTLLRDGGLTQLRDALAKLIQRHPSLRTEYATGLTGTPCQRIQEDVASDWGEVEAESWTPTELRAKVEEEAQRPFDLSTPPLLRARVFHRKRRRAGEEGLASVGSVVLLVTHRLAVDLWSLLLLLDDLRILLLPQPDLHPQPPGPQPPEARGRAESLPPLSYDVTDYAQWMHDVFPSTPQAQALSAYWVKKIGHNLPVLNLCGDPVRPGAISCHGASHAFTLPRGPLRRLASLSQREGAPLSCALLCLFLILLGKHSDEADVLLGCTLPCRHRLGFRDVLGDLANTVVLRGDLSGDPSFLRLLRRLRRELNGAMAHGQLPLPRLLHLLHPSDTHTHDHKPLPFQVMFATVPREQQWTPCDAATWLVLGHSDKAPPLHLGGLSLQPMGLSPAYAPCDLTLLVSEDVHGDVDVPASFSYRADLLSGDTVASFAAHLTALLHAVVKDPRAPLTALPFLPSSGPPPVSPDTPPALQAHHVSWCHMVDDSRQTQPLVDERDGGLVEQTGRVDWDNRALDLGEIESVLLEWEGVAAARVAALVCPRSGEVARIVAYVAPVNGDTPLPFRALRGHLATQLPEHLQPTRLVICDTLPPALCPQSVAPVTEFEEVMADLFADLLHLPRVPMGGHFFELGGHSLLAVQLVARLRRALGVDIALSRVWETPTVAGLAEVVEMVYLATGAIDPSRRELPRGALPDLLARHAAPGGAGEKAEDAAAAEPRGGRQCFASLSQSSLYFLWCWDKDSPALNVSLPVRLLSRPIDQSALRSAIQSLLDRHPPLRTTYLLSDGVLHAWVQGPGMCPVDLQVVELKGSDCVHSAMDDDAHAPFDLHDGPLFRARLYEGGTISAGGSSTEGSDLMHLLLVWHSIAVDQWSVGLLLEEFGLLYDAFRCPVPLLSFPSLPTLALPLLPTPLPPPPATYAHFTQWQASLLSPPEGQRLWAYWERELAGVTQAPALTLPTDYPRPAVQTFRGDLPVPFRIPAPVTAALQTLASREGSTLQSVLLSVWMLLLRRHAGSHAQRHDILVGVPMANRPETQLETIVGHLTNPAVIRARLPPDEAGLTFRAFLQSVSRSVACALAHQSLPLALLVDRLCPPRDPSRPVLYQTTFVLDKADNHRRLHPTPTPSSSHSGDGSISSFLLGEAGSVLRLTDGLVLGSVRLPCRACLVDVALSMAHVDGELRGYLTYNADLFARATLLRLSEGYLTLLEHVVALPSAPLAHLPALSADDLQRVLCDLYRPPAHPPTTEADNVRQLFERQAALTPDRVALCSSSSSSSTLTYRALDRLSNQVGNYLHATASVGPEAVVAICLPRGLSLCVAMLGALKAGGAYLPLDPSSPPSHLHRLLTLSRARVLITEARLLASLPTLPPGLHPLCVDGDGSVPWSPVASHSPSPCPPSTHCHVNHCLTLAFHLHHGLVITHGNILHLIAWHAIEYRPCSEDVGCLLLPPGADPAGLELWPLLSVGGRVILLPDEASSSPPSLLAALQTHHVTMALLPAPLCDAMLEQQGTQLWPPSLRLLCTTNGRLRRPPPKRLPFRLDCLYSPVTCPLVAACHTASHHDPTPLPLGWPVGHSACVVVDSQCLHPVPSGVIGELLLGGPWVPRGYLPAVAHGPTPPDRFLANPFARQPNMPELDGRYDTLFRTAELVKYRDDGRLEYVGGLDRYASVRGVRLCLSTVEQAIRDGGGVADVAVIGVPEKATGEVRLVAYCVLVSRSVSRASSSSASSPRSDALPSFEVADANNGPPPDVRGLVSRRLPQYMVPAACVFLPSLPRGADGEVNVTLLPHPSWAGTQDPRQPPPPQEAEAVGGGEDGPVNETEEALVALFEQVLGLGDEDDTSEEEEEAAEPLEGAGENNGGVPGGVGVSVGASFFALGGNSLLAAALVTRIHEVLGHSLPLHRVFQHPSVRGLSAFLLSGSSDDSLPSSSPGPGLMSPEGSLLPSASSTPHHGSLTTLNRPTLDDLSPTNMAALGPSTNAEHWLSAEPVLPADLWPHRSVLEGGSPRIDSPMPAYLQQEAGGPRRGGLFLTGATGFLGAFVLKELLEDTTFIIYCLVRGADATAGYGRVQASLLRYELFGAAADAETAEDTALMVRHLLETRVIVVLGDLAKPLFGLSRTSFDRLGKEVESILHCAANVDPLLPYAALRPCNVQGVLTLLSLAATHHDKPLHVVSSLHVFASGRHVSGRLMLETSPLAPPEEMDTACGYAQSKWVAEHLLFLARDRGFRIAIYRPGHLLPDTATGAASPNDVMTRLLMASVRMGSYPLLRWRTRGLSVSVAARVLKTAVDRQLALGRNVHLVAGTQPLEWSGFLGAAAAGGLALHPLPFGEWAQRADKAIARAGEAKKAGPRIPRLQELRGGEEIVAKPDGLTTLLPVLRDVGVELDMPAADTRNLREVGKMMQQDGGVGLPFPVEEEEQGGAAKGQRGKAPMSEEAVRAMVEYMFRNALLEGDRNSRRRSGRGNGGGHGL